MRSNLARTAFYITLITLISKTLGFGRDIVMAAIFGATSLTDDFVMAQSILGVVTAMLMGALATTFLPVYTEYHEKKDSESQRNFLNAIYSIALALALILSLLSALIPRQLVSLFAPEFSSENAVLTAHLLQALTPVILLTLVMTLDAAVLQVNGRFLATVAIGLPANIVLIAGMLLLTRPLGIYSLVLSTIVGSASQVLMLWLVKRRLKLSFRPQWNLKEEGVRRIGTLVVPILLGSGISQINTFVDRSLASGLPTGSVAALAFSNRLSIFLLGLVSASVVSVFYASMSSLNATGQIQEFKSLLRNTINIIILILAPCTALLIALRLPVVTLIFEHGEFNRSASEMTANALFFYSIGLMGFALRDVFSRSFYARKDTKTAMINGVFAVILNIVFAVTLTPVMGLGGLALASSISGVVGTLLLGLSLFRMIGDYGIVPIGKVFLKVSVASAVMGFAVNQLYGLVFRQWNSNVLALVLSTAAGVLLYFLLVLLLRVEEVGKLLAMFRTKTIRPIPVPTGDAEDRGL